MRDIWVYDIEVMGGNFFSATFMNAHTGEIQQSWVLNETYSNIDFVEEVTNNALLIGYNNTMYDDIILNYIWENKEINTQEIYALSTMIISHQRSGIPLWRNEDVAPYMNRRVRSLDLMKILAFDKLKVSLKQCAVNLRHHKIQDLPLDHEDYVRQEDLETILSYNLNDVLITVKLLETLKEAINLRFKISREYRVNVKNASRTYIGKEILNKYYADYTKQSLSDFKELRTPRTSIVLAECIQPNIFFTTPTFMDMLKYFKSQTIYSVEKSIDYKLIFNEKGYQMGFGGLHSIDRPAIFTSREDVDIIDADVDSYYPFVMINYKIKPEHCSDEFTTVLADITERRLRAKKAKDKITAETLKITVNSIFGLLGFENYWLYDPKAALSVTINGQLFLLMLIERLETNGFEVISANTDGITSYVPKNRTEEYNKICKEWAEYTGFSLSFSKYTKYIRRDVNNYIVLKEDGETKSKGIFVEEQSLEKGYNTSIIPKALNKYFLYGKPIEETLDQCKDIFDFCLSEKSGNQFKMELHYLDGDKKMIKELQKTNRYFISKKGGTFIKRKGDSSLYNMQVGWQVYILNSYEAAKIDEYLANVDKRYYLSECNKIIQSIEDKQLKLF